MRVLALTCAVALAACSSAPPRESGTDAGTRDAGHDVTKTSIGDAADVRAPDVGDAGDGGGGAVEGGTEGQSETTIVGPLTIHVNTSLPASQRVLDEASAIVSGAKQTTYSHTTYIDESTGTYDVDCSGFTNFVIQQADSAAFTELVAATAPRPLAAEYARFFVALPAAGSGSWHQVTVAMNLVPGDLVAWVEPPQLNSTDTGHTFVVAAPPSMGENEVDIEIYDSTATGHGSTDPRTIAGTTGVGEASVAITVDAAGLATGYRWAVERGVLAYTTTVGMAHLE